MQGLVQELANIQILERRHRKVFVQGDIDELAESILDLGLMHAPVVRQDGFTLIAGERRLKAIQKLSDQGLVYTYDGVEIEPGFIPVVSLEVATELRAKEAELHENIRRVNLTYKEKAQAVAELHEFREEERAERGEVQTKRDTAEELYPEVVDNKSSMDNRVKDVKRDLVVAQFLNDPEVAKATTQTEAIKIITKLLERKRRKKLAETFDLEKLDAVGHRLIAGDVFEELIKLDSGTFDLIIADPPYGINADSFRNQKAERHTYVDTPEYADKITKFILEGGYTLSRKQAHLYMFCDILRFPQIKLLAEAAGWSVWNKPLIWFKGGNAGIAPRPEHGPRYTYEAILYAFKGNKRAARMAPPDVILIPHDRTIERGAHKPADLYAELISRSCAPGDKVLDPTCGTGPIFPAATQCKVTATGIEIDDTAIAICYERLAQVEDTRELEAELNAD